MHFLFILSNVPLIIQVLHFNDISITFYHRIVHPLQLLGVSCIFNFFGGVGDGFQASSMGRVARITNSPWWWLGWWHLCWRVSSAANRSLQIGDLFVSGGRKEYLCFSGWRECLRTCKACSMGDLWGLATTFFFPFVLDSFHYFAPFSI